MRSFRDLSIKYKVMSILMLVSCISLLLAGGIFLLVETRTYRKRYITNLSSISEIIGANSISALLFDDDDAARTTLSALSAQSTVTECGLYRRDGTLFARYVMKDSKREEPPVFREPGTYFEKGNLILFSSIIWKGETMGVVYIRSDMAELRERIQQYAGITATILVVALCAAVLLSLWLHRVVSSPVSQLTEVAHNIAEKRDYSIRVPAGRHGDELGVLIRVFNQMLDQIQERDSDLQKARDELEVMVEERTKEVREMSQILKGMLFNMPIITFRADENGVFTELIGKGLQRLGLKPNEMVGQSAFKIFPDFEDEMKKAIAGHITTREATGAKDGERWYLSSYFFPDADRPGHVVGFALDITARKRAEEHEKVLQDQLVRAERMRSLGVLAGGVAHDLNNILGSMLILPEVIRDDIEKAFEDKKEELAETIADLKTIESSAKRASAVIKDLMTLGRRGNYQRVPLLLDVLVQKYLKSREFVSLSESHPKIAVSTDIAENVKPVEGSESHLTRVLANLVLNACEAISGQGAISIEIRNTELKNRLIGYEIIPQGEYVVLSVMDDGAGIESSNIEKIFEPFFTKKKMTGRSGSGLGLSVVHGVVKDHNGYLDVTSFVGKGTSFQLYLPVTESQPQQEQEKQRDALRGGTENILVVDDEASQRQLCKRALEKLGYSVATAASGREALKKFNRAYGRKNAFDLVILDMIMEEDFDGLTTYEQILKKAPEQKVIIASGYSPTRRGKTAMELGAAWLAKPYDTTDLAVAVREKIDEA